MEKEHVENFQLASQRAYLEYEKDVKSPHKLQPSKLDFKNMVISFAPAYASSKEQRITKQHGTNKRKGIEKAKMIHKKFNDISQKPPKICSFLSKQLRKL